MKPGIVIRAKRKVATLMISAKDESIEVVSSDATYVLR